MWIQSSYRWDTEIWMAWKNGICAYRWCCCVPHPCLWAQGCPRTLPLLFNCCWQSWACLHSLRPLSRPPYPHKVLSHILSFFFSLFFFGLKKRIKQYMTLQWMLFLLHFRFKKLADRPSYDFNTSKLQGLGFKSFRSIPEMFDDCITSLVDQGHLSHWLLWKSAIYQWPSSPATTRTT